METGKRFSSNAGIGAREAEALKIRAPRDFRKYAPALSDMLDNDASGTEGVSPTFPMTP